MTSISPIIGIDLGTTTSAAAYVDHTGRPTSIVNFEGGVLTPSAVLIEGDSAVVGIEAQKGAQTNASGYADCFKRYMGERLYPKEVDGRPFRPEFLSAMVLHRIKQDTSRPLGEVKKTVVTVPAYFDECRRRATENAASIADWNVVDIINEPTAAAIAYAHRAEQLRRRSTSKECILVYDLGGGTFDTTVLEVCYGLAYRTVATDGEVRLGGYDWDDRLCQYLCEQFHKKTGCNPLDSELGKMDFSHHAHQAKHSLSLRKSILVPVVFEGHRTMLEVSRDTFESLTSDLLDRSRTTTEFVLDQAKKSWADIDRILLVGGSTRMPMVSRMMEKLTGRKPDTSMSADESVAHGAAIYAALQGGETKIQIVNVNAHSIRIIGQSTEDPRKSIAREMIPKNSPLPATKAKLIPVVKPGQRNAVIQLCEGESENPADCQKIGKVRIELPDLAFEKLKVRVAVKCQPDGTIAVHGSVRDPNDVDNFIQNVAAILEPSLGMTPHEVRKAKRELQRVEIA